MLFGLWGLEILESWVKEEEDLRSMSGRVLLNGILCRWGFGRDESNGYEME